MAFRTQKISQMTPKGANLEATDLIEVSTIESGSYVTRSITGQEIIDAAVGNVDWGDIGGTLSAQTDLQNALDAKVPTSRTLTINGVTQDLSANRTFTISTGITIGSTAIASGVVGRVLFEGAGNVVQESSSLFWDNTNARLGIGTSTPATALDLNSNFTFNTGVGRLLNIKANSGPTVIAGFGTGINFGLKISSGIVEDVAQIDAVNNQVFRSSDLIFRVSQGSTPAEAMRINYLGGVQIGTTTNAGFKLDVNGTARINNNLTINNGTFYYVNQYTQSGDFWISANGVTNVLFSNGANNNFGRLQFGGTTTSYPALQRVSASLAIVDAAGGTSGNLLIGTTTDAGYKLDVNGTARVSGKLSVNTPTATSAVMEVTSTTQGFLPPRMTTTQKNAIASPAAGLVVYDTTLNKLCVYTTAWETVTSL